MTTFAFHIHLSVCFGGKFQKALSVIGLDCIDFFKASYYPYIGLLVPYTFELNIWIAKASFKISWPVHDLAPAVHAHCNRKSAASRKATASENYWWNLLIQYYSQKQLCEPGFIALAFKSRLGPHCPGFVSVSPRSTCFTKFNEARGKPRITIDAHILVWFWYVKVYDETLYLWLQPETVTMARHQL